MEPVRALLEGIVDYAGLFPPAQLGWDEAVAQYREHRRHKHAWMLARFILPEDKLAAAECVPRASLVCRGESVRLPVLAPNVECVEVNGSLAQPVRRFTVHELNWREELEPQIARIQAGDGLKLRTGGLSPDAVPPSPQLALALWHAARAGVPVKFTAGLHHPFPTSGQHGFLNVFAAALAAFEYQAPTDAIESLLTEMHARFTSEAFHAGRYVFPVDKLRRLRATRVLSFGSCSFLEPVEHLESLGIL
jgi:hypothetical protein